MAILITGANGLLGQKLVAQLSASSTSFIASSKGENRNPECPASHYVSLDISRPEELEHLLAHHPIDAIVNTAAMTDVDACEEEEESCRKVNVEGVRNLYRIARKNAIFLVQLSTDFVFDGEDGPYSEEDERRPLSCYATSKRDAEDILLNGDYRSWAILRTIIVFGQGHHLSRSNIVLWARDALKKGTPMRVVNDQFRAPTWADDLAWACLRSVQRRAEGIFHISGPETMSIYDLVGRIAAYYQLGTSAVESVSSATLQQRAKRPPRTGFDLSKSRRLLGYRPMTLEESLARMPWDEPI